MHSTRYAFANRPEGWRSEAGADVKAELRAMFGGFASPVPEVVEAIDLVRGADCTGLRGVARTVR